MYRHFVFVKHYVSGENVDRRMELTEVIPKDWAHSGLFLFVFRFSLDLRVGKRGLKIIT